MAGEEKEGVLGIKLESTACKANALPTIVSLASLDHPLTHSAPPVCITYLSVQASVSSLNEMVGWIITSVVSSTEAANSNIQLMVCLLFLLWKAFS